MSTDDTTHGITQGTARSGQDAAMNRVLLGWQLAGVSAAKRRKLLEHLVDDFAAYVEPALFDDALTGALASVGERRLVGDPPAPATASPRVSPWWETR